MRIISKVFAAALAAVWLAATPVARGAEAPAALRAQIVTLTQQLMDAVTLGKPEVWDRILADDALIIDEFGRKQGKREAVKDLKPLPSGLSGTIEVRDPHVRAYGDTAVIDCEAYERETVFGQQLVVRYVIMATYVRRSGAWKLAGMENLTLPTDPPALTVRGLHLDDYPGTYRYGPERAFTISRRGDDLYVRAGASGKEQPLRPVAMDVFTDGGDEKNLLIFQRDDAGRVNHLIERRKFNDLHMTREVKGAP